MFSSLFSYFRDAAHQVHPLAGQGLNLGFGDVVELTKILGEAVENGCKLNDMHYLHEYETQRQRYNVPLMFTIDALHRLYDGTATPIVLARSLGLQLTNAIPPLKVRQTRKVIPKYTLRNKYFFYIYINGSSILFLENVDGICRRKGVD